MHTQCDSDSYYEFSNEIPLRKQMEIQTNCVALLQLQISFVFVRTVHQLYIAVVFPTCVITKLHHVWDYITLIKPCKAFLKCNIFSHISKFQEVTTKVRIDRHKQIFRLKLTQQISVILLWHCARA